MNRLVAERCRPIWNPEAANECRSLCNWTYSKRRPAAAVALNYFSYNFIQIHRTLRTSPAMAAGVTDKLWRVADLVALWESEEQEGKRAA
jgi:hypothetical protein